MYEFILLAQLMNGPAHGYLIAKIINDIIGPFARISYGRLYPLLAKLEENGLIAVEGEVREGKQHDRQLRIFSITHAGRMRFLLLMNDTSLYPGEYRKLFSYKVTAFSHISLADRLHLIDHYITYCQASIAHEQTEAEDMLLKAVQMDEMYRDSPDLAHGFPRLTSYSIEAIVNVLQHSVDRWRLELEWARQLRAREMELATRTSAESSAGVEAEQIK